MQVTLISASRAVDHDAAHLTDVQQLVAYCARVSNPTNQANTLTSDKLIQYLIDHGHWSPLEMASACLEVNTTRDIARQILRHRSFSFQEFSQRYADPTKDLNFATREARLQDNKNRQNSIEVDDPLLHHAWAHAQQRVIDAAKQEYEWAIAHGIAKEQARAVLPEGLMGTRIYMAGSIRSWVHYISVRTKPDVQKEHRDVARACADALTTIFPMIQQFVAT